MSTNENGVIVAIDELDSQWREKNITFNGEELAAIAARLNIPAIVSLEAKCRARRASGLIEVSGVIRSELERECVATLAPISENIDENFHLTFRKYKSADEMPRGAEIEEDDDYEGPEPLFEDEIDMTEITIQHLSLAMDPYPRDPDAEPVRVVSEPEELSPFSVLKT